MSKRIEWIDVTKCLCMLCIIFSHSIYSTDLFVNFVSPFILVTFFFCAGYCYKHRVGFNKFLYKKVRQLFIPWFVFSYANILLSYILSFKEHIAIKDELIRNLLQIRGYDDKLWFIAAMFIAYIPFYYVMNYAENHLEKRKTILIILLVLYFVRELYSDFMPSSFFPWGSSNLPWHLDYIPNMMFYMYLGYYFRLFVEKTFDKNNSLIFSVLLIVAYFVFVYLINNNNVFIHNIYKIVRHIIAISMIVSISKKIPTNRFLSFVGMNTLIYFSIHNKVLTLLEIVSGEVGIITSFVNTNQIFSNIYGIMMTMLASILLIIPTKFINEYCPKLLGKEI